MERPHVVLILLDDVGTEAISCYGNPGAVATPHIDRIAQQGAKFTRTFATPVCTPSRMQLLTGTYPFQNGVEKNLFTYPVQDQVVPAETPNIARLMQQAGYRTLVAGKWQLCRFNTYPNHPRQFGFDDYLLWTWRITQNPKEKKKSRYWNPAIWQDGKLRPSDGDQAFGPDMFAEKIIAAIQANDDKPLFAFHPMALPHLPLVATPAEKKQFAKMSTDQKWAAMMRYADVLIGRVAEAIDQAGLAEQTLLIVTSDNGTPSRVQVRVDGKLKKGGKASLTDHGTNVPMVVRWTGTIKPGQTIDALNDFTDILPTICQAAGVSIPKDMTVMGHSWLDDVGVSQPVAHRDWVLVQHGEEIALRGQRYKWYTDGRLFDLKHDPEEKAALSKPYATDARHAVAHFAQTWQQMSSK